MNIDNGRLRDIIEIMAYYQIESEHIRTGIFHRKQVESESVRKGEGDNIEEEIEREVEGDRETTCVSIRTGVTETVVEECMCFVDKVSEMGRY